MKNASLALGLILSVLGGKKPNTFPDADRLSRRGKYHGSGCDMRCFSVFHPGSADSREPRWKKSVTTYGQRSALWVSVCHGDSERC